MVGMGGSNNSVGDGGRGGRRWSIVVNATLFLPISESMFADANDPLLARY